MADQELLNALSDCIDRLAAGYSIEDCLAEHPDQAAVLRSMLEAGRLVHRARASSLEVAQAQERMRFRMQGQIRRQARHSLGPLRAVGSLSMLVILLFGGAVLWQMMRDRNNKVSPIEMTAVATATMSATPTMMIPEFTLTPTTTATVGSSSTPTPTATMTPTVRAAPRITRTSPSGMSAPPASTDDHGSDLNSGTSVPPASTPVPPPVSTDDHGDDQNSDGDDSGGGEDSSGGGGK